MSKRKSSKSSSSSWTKPCSIFLGIILLSVIYAFCVLYIQDTDNSSDYAKPIYRNILTASKNSADAIESMFSAHNNNITTATTNNT